MSQTSRQELRELIRELNSSPEVFFDSHMMNAELQLQSPPLTRRPPYRWIKYNWSCVVLWMSSPRDIQTFRDALERCLRTWLLPARQQVATQNLKMSLAHSRLVYEKSAMSSHYKLFICPPLQEAILTILALASRDRAWMRDLYMKEYQRQPRPRRHLQDRRPHNLSAISLNINHVSGKRGMTQELLNSEEPDILLLQETVLVNTLRAPLFIGSYKGVERRIVDEQGRGLAILVRRTSNLKIHKILSSDGILSNPNFLFAMIEGPSVECIYRDNMKCIIGSVYVPHQAPLQFLSSLNTALQALARHFPGVPVILGGDFNMKASEVMDRGIIIGRRLVPIPEIRFFSVCDMGNRPTRQQVRDGELVESSIDHFFTRSTRQPDRSEVLNRWHFLSDHLPIRVAWGSSLADNVPAPSICRSQHPESFGHCVESPGDWVAPPLDGMSSVSHSPEPGSSKCRHLPQRRQ